MLHNANIHDEIEDMQRKLAFSEACADTLDFDQLLTRASALLHKWAQADVVTLILPPEREELEPMLHIFGRQPVLPLAERSIRDECALLLGELDFAHLPGEALRLRRGPELMPLHSPVRDDYMYRFWSQEMAVDGQVVGIVALFGFTDWLLSPRIRRLLGALVPVIARAVATAASIENLRLCAHKDDVTGGYNRRGFEEVLERACVRAEVFDEPLALLLFDVEEYGPLSGSPEGEAMLRALAEVVRASVRPFDVLARFGEAELSVLMPAADVDEASAIAEALLDASRQVTVRSAPVHLNVGVAMYDGGPPAGLVQAADQALYEARRQSVRAAGHAG